MLKKNILHYYIMIYMRLFSRYSTQENANILIIDFVKFSLNCYLEKTALPVRSLIQCARQCAFNLSCDGILFDANHCLMDGMCPTEDLPAGCIHLIKTELSKATVFRENTIIISKRGITDIQTLKQCFPPPTIVVEHLTVSYPESECNITGAIFINITNEVWLFSRQCIYMYDAVYLLGTRDFRNRQVADMFPDLPGPVQAGYNKDRRIHLIVGSDVFTYDLRTKPVFTKRETIYQHFRPEVPSNIDGLIVNDSIMHMFSKNYVFDISSGPMVIKPFHSRSVYNPYRSTYLGNMPDGVTAATGVGPNTFLFINNKTHYLFQISSLKKGTHAGEWNKGKNPLQC